MNAFCVSTFEIMTPGAGANFEPKDHMYELGKDPQGDAAYQISKLYVFQFQRKRILKMGFFVPMSQLVTPGAGPILIPVASYKQTW